MNQQNRYNLLKHHWWHKATRKLVGYYVCENYLKNRNKSMIYRLLDAGCGEGIMYHELYQVFKSIGTKVQLVGIDIDEDNVNFCRRLVNEQEDNIKLSSIDSIPYPDNFFDCVLCIDVLYHNNVVDDEKALKEIYRVLKPDGEVIIQVPAYEFLRSGHDRIADTRHRYLLNELKDAMIKAGLKIELISYRNTVLFPLMVIVRLINKIFNYGSDLNATNELLNTILYKITLLDNGLVKRHSLLYGLSIFAVGVKNEKKIMQF